MSALGRGFRASLQEGLARLPNPNGARLAEVFPHGTLQGEVYAPRGTDPQQPHERDEDLTVWILFYGPTGGEAGTDSG